METRRDAPASISANARLAALRTGPAQDSPAASGPMTLSEAIAAGYHARRPWWQRFGEALAGRVPDTLRGRWTLEARAAVALAAVALVGAVVGGWYFWRSQSTVVALPGASAANAVDPVPNADPDPAPNPAMGAAMGTAVDLPSFGGAASRDARQNAAAPHGGGEAGALSPGPLASAAGPGLVVDVEGKVGHPGVVGLPPGSRVYEALKAAGGTAAGADTTGLDLARPLVDGEQLRVGLPGAAMPPSGVTGAAPPARGGRKAKPAEPVNLNTATLEQLETIPGVGPAMAQRVLDWRTEHGRFGSVDQLREVKGIGDRKFAAMKDSVTV